MPARTIALISAGIFVFTAGVVLALWWAGTAGLSGQALVTARFDALRTGLSIGIGSGGIFALYLAWRRQHATEVALLQKERDHELQLDVTEHTRLDAEARRVTELYSKSSEQLGSDKAPVRLAGLYALERLAQDNPDQRQTVVNVLCAYLRMPYTLPVAPPADDTDEATRTRHDTSLQEREVRFTAQNILTGHLYPGPTPDDPIPTFWPDTDLNLTGAALIEFDLAHGQVRNARFDKATFAGDAQFGGTMFTGTAWFAGAMFTGDARFDKATFAGDAQFGGTMFTGTAWFGGATFTGDAQFGGARFAGTAWFGGAMFTGDARFDGARFAGTAWFGGAMFTGDARFDGATFAGDAQFDKATFTGTADFDKTTFTGDAQFDRTTFTGNAEFDGVTFGGTARFSGATFTTTAVFSEATFAGKVWFDKAITRHPFSNSNWPAGWTPTDDHTPIGGREGTWHLLQRT
ncbi:pentapeptide repeat-containing protein [Lentzea sp. CA-135723]|uniref:pentapeptide repeat-containing protein n=1 Tax=Lentzea sp. CA-135723 TaxID=3239950 RepID=UPI003D92774B